MTRHLVPAALGLALAAAGGLLWLYLPPAAHPPATESAALPATPGPPWFADVTDAVGLDFTHDAGPVDGKFFMPQALGSGAALLDADGDGRLDLYLLNNGGPAGQPNRLFLQTPEARFRDATDGSGLGLAGYCMGAAVGDIDGDGRPDLAVTLFGGVRLFHNEGGGHFADRTRAAGLENPSWGTSAAFADLDGDGRQDLVVVNYVAYDPSWPCTTPRGDPEYCPPQTFPGTVTRLFRNLGPAEGTPARFEDVTARSGLGAAPVPGLGVAIADFTGDGRPDVFVANDGKPNRLWVNRGGLTFADEAVRRGVAYNAMSNAEAGMGVALGDLDGDGRFDVFVTHLTEETHTLWLQGLPGTFRDRTAAAGLARPRWRATGFGTACADFDRDGRPDLAVANGRIAAADAPASTPLGSHWGRYAERNQLFANLGGHFADRSDAEIALCGTPNVARGLACGDLDGDGAPDLLVTTAGGRARLLRNTAPAGHWLAVRAVVGNSDAHSAEVTLTAGGSARWGLCQPAGSYLCAGDGRARFGLGPLARYDAVVVRWPDGSREEYPGGPADRTITLRKGEGRRP